jgi:sugar phosphate isomerase/epimerase
MSMRRAFSKPTADNAQLQALMTGFRDAGYEGLQLKKGQFTPYLDDADGWQRTWGDDRGRVSALIAFDTLEPDGVARLSATVRFAERVGAERIVYCHNHPRDGVTAEQLRGFARTISELGRDAAQRGVALSLHHHYDQPVMHREDFEVFFGAVEPGTVGLTIDTAHLAKSGITDLPGFVRDFAGVIDNLHLKDFADGEWRLLGQGELPLAEILDALGDAGYPGWLCVDEESRADLETGLTVSAKWLDAHFGARP